MSSAFAHLSLRKSQRNWSAREFNSARLTSRTTFVAINVSSHSGVKERPPRRRRGTFSAGRWRAARGVSYGGRRVAEDGRVCERRRDHSSHGSHRPENPNTFELLQRGSLFRSRADERVQFFPERSRARAGFRTSSDRASIPTSSLVGHPAHLGYEPSSRTPSLISCRRAHVTPIEPNFATG